MNYQLGAIFLGCTLLSMSANALEVSCQNVAGQCKVSEDTTECNCKNGMGMGSSTGYDPDAPLPDPKTEEELLEECETFLVENCGDSEPDVNEHCTADQLSLCTSYLEIMAQLEENCDFGSGDSTSTTEPATEPEPEPEPDDGDAPAGRPLFPPTVPDNPWIISECCDEVNEDTEGSLKKAIDCVSNLEATDCDEAEACFEEADIGWDYPTAQDKQDGSGGESSADPNGQNLDEESDTNVDDGGDSNSCQVSSVLGKISFSLVALLANIF